MCKGDGEHLLLHCPLCQRVVGHDFFPYLGFSGDALGGLYVIDLPAC